MANAEYDTPDEALIRILCSAPVQPLVWPAYWPCQRHAPPPAPTAVRSIASTRGGRSVVIDTDAGCFYFTKGRFVTRTNDRLAQLGLFTQDRDCTLAHFEESVSLARRWCTMPESEQQAHVERLYTY
jgi:hypothetical protein